MHEYQENRTFIYAIQQGNLDVLARSIRDGIDLNLPFSEDSLFCKGKVPLIATFFAQENRVEMFKMMLDAGAELDLQTGESNASTFALATDNVAIMNIILDRNLTPKNNCGEPIPLLHTAINQNAENIVSNLISRGFDVNEKIHEGLTPLHAACKMKDFTDKFIMIQLLIVGGADITIEDNQGNVPGVYLEPPYITFHERKYLDQLVRKNAARKALDQFDEIAEQPRKTRRSI